MSCAEVSPLALNAVRSVSATTVTFAVIAVGHACDTDDRIREQTHIRSRRCHRWTR